jgi:tetratricopeptide (TPR) repeat protein
MGSAIADLQQRAVEFAKSGDFGANALETNLELTRIAPSNEGAWTRLARCYMELGQLDEATAALDSALGVNPQNTIARNLQMEVTKRRVGATASLPAVRGRAVRKGRAESTPGAPAGGFGRPEFAALGQLAPAAAVEALAPRIETLLMTLNDRPFAVKAVEARNRAGRAGGKLFRRNSFYPGSAGHIFAFQHGGRWEPQLNVGFFAAEPWGRNAVRAGIGFNFTPEGNDVEREADRERLLATFEHFQRLVGSEWRKLLTDWMTANGGFIQHGRRPPDVDLLPAAAIEWLVNCRNPTEAGWIFCGRWLFADKAGDADILADGRRLTAWIDQAFTDLLPLWTSLYRS